MKKKVINLIGLLLLVTGFFVVGNTEAANTDMVDVSNHNGYMTTANFIDMRNNYGVKAVVTKVTEGTYYHDYTAKNNIYTAQQAGLYINAYHFARYTTYQGAVNEANYAAQMAKADGLPIGSVIVADVEASQQQGISRYQNNINNQAFMNTIKQYGYRSDVYTMSSWLGSVMDVNAGGWIASYPYNASGKQWYSSNHAWQWGSTYQFAGSYGNFDVSQLYDNFYTGQLQALVDPRQSINNVVSVKGNKYKAYSTYTKEGQANEGTDVLSGTDWQSAGIIEVAGLPYYYIGLNTYIPQNKTTFNRKVVINYRSDYGVNAYNKKGQSIKDSNTRFKGGTEWATVDKLTYINNVGWCYQVSTDEYIPVKFQQGSGFKG
ncbi:GH25 family lysozyme [Companilactobacillus sp.]|jgi:GH25 family lysozyme M1 (1,4-beta-N-acetylmuramidase)|uniref:GH25 family lysozyme n=1 Tax=Companilactobacillus sp. TaxID=2767905 RepID=UPI0025C5DC0F|nr:GH25 family lysozyme [Companilactobacillus sp.]MCH4008157.1 1,4-beta-N-acetylmuramidase [Companilactobacillus sp.]MCH4051664.1 1,4-beta-N-acetylmuramidase [Companilactobacillus sp.]MCH4076100.1 1,4-beta-N-acetylmuramidase [Companilactobacillus sp.]MCH4124675.1 1,4-beta-N-acetylmuramidase [Companilactobacillus sp.]MCH4149652.1 1,4-beta-N-acetylmuramidase [Companilactobacillus sp.]